jgi:hypothetical protein
MKHIKLFETWQGFSKSEDEEEKDYRVSLDKLLTWAVDQDWSSDWSWMPNILMVNDEFPDEGECIGYLELLKKNREVEIEVYSQMIDGQVDSSWVIDDTVFDLITWEWPFEDADSLDDLENATVRKLVDEIGEGGLIEIGANIVDLIDFVDWSGDRGEDLTTLTPIGFRNWFRLQRGGAN